MCKLVKTKIRKVYIRKLLIRVMGHVDLHTEGEVVTMLMGKAEWKEVLDRDVWPVEAEEEHTCMEESRVAVLV